MCQFKFDPDDKSFASHVHFMYDGKIYNNMDEIKKEYEFVKQPIEIPLGAVREGTYVIRERGFYQEYEHYKEFWVKKGKWGNGIMRGHWGIFPRLSDKEYQELNNIPRKVLNKEWLQNVTAYLHWRDTRQIRRDVRKTFLKV